MDSNLKMNYILFLVLSTLVIIGYSYFFSKDAEKEKTQVTKTQTNLESPTKTNDINVNNINEEINTANEKYSGEIINIESDLYTVKIDTLGPKIVEWNLKKYKQSIEPEAPSVKIVDKTKNSFNTIINIKNKDIPPLIPFRYSGKKNLILDSESVNINLSWSDKSGIIINKTLTFYPDKYFIEEYLNIKNNSDTKITEKVFINWSNNVFESSNRATNFNFVTLVNNDVERIKKSVKEPKKFTGQIDWFGFSDKYFLHSLLPNLGENLNLDIGSENNKGIINANFSYPAHAISPNNNKELKWRVYLGPKDTEILKTVHPSLEQSVDYGYVGSLTKIAVKILKFTNQYINNYGISIIVITIVLRLIFLPITVKSMISMKKVQQKMQAIKPQIDALKEKYKDDRQTQQTEMMKLYTSHGVNPLSSLGGCLPLLIQFPVFIALYFALLYSIDLRQSSFLWIQDLAEPEHLFDILGIPFRILPLLMGVSWFFSQRLTPMTSPGSETMELQMKMMQFMPIIFTVMFWGLPSGLILYWTVSNILSIGQQLYINRHTTSLQGG
ncbi:MAG: membrane protein insertase YidC [Candidatus Dadabacteria bacterium]|nr:membrane protein insertase YidC [Candidatus Dadabacteria bacterium]NIQ17052.1 membrane protein insertase YidC [Candidatus Dadabacteria bacterium]